MKKLIMGIVATMMLIGTTTANAQGFNRHYPRYGGPREEWRADRDRYHHRHRDYECRDYPMPPAYRPAPRPVVIYHEPEPVVVHHVIEPEPVVVHHVIEPEPRPRHHYRRRSSGNTAAAVAAGAVLGAVLMSAVAR